MVKGARHMSACKGIGKFTLPAESLQQALATAIHKEPVRLKPYLVGVSPLNRQFSIKHVHRWILQSFFSDGHDPNRPAVGICREVRDAQKRLQLENHNKALAANWPFMPSVEEGAMRYECLASNHYNVASRLVEERSVS